MTRLAALRHANRLTRALLCALALALPVQNFAMAAGLAPATHVAHVMSAGADHLVHHLTAAPSDEDGAACPMTICCACLPVQPLILPLAVAAPGETTCPTRRSAWPLTQMEHPPRLS